METKSGVCLFFLTIISQGQKYPQIIFNDATIVKPSIATGLLRSVFIEDERSFSKRLFQQFRSNGFFAMLEMLISAVGRNRDQSNIKVNGNNVFLKIFYFIALIIVHVKFVYLKIHYYFYPFDKVCFPLSQCHFLTFWF